MSRDFSRLASFNPYPKPYAVQWVAEQNPNPEARVSVAEIEPTVKPTKPLGRKSYGSIPHLPGSRMGPADHHCHAGQEAICMTRGRDRHDRVIVTEKLDGGNVAVANVEGRIVALGRAGYLASDSPFVQHHYFARWIADQGERFAAMLGPGERLNGEWLALAHGTRYALPHEPFVAFDMMVEAKRLPWDVTAARCAHHGVTTARVLSDGPPLHVDDLIPLIAQSGHGALDEVEGAVWRVERRGEFDFMAKWVRPTKEDGKYLTEISGHPEIWHWRPA